MCADCKSSTLGQKSSCRLHRRAITLSCLCKIHNKIVASLTVFTWCGACVCMQFIIFHVCFVCSLAVQFSSGRHIQCSVCYAIGVLQSGAWAQGKFTNLNHAKVLKSVCKKSLMQYTFLVSALRIWSSLTSTMPILKKHFTKKCSTLASDKRQQINVLHFLLCRGTLPSNVHYTHPHEVPRVS